MPEKTFDLNIQHITAFAGKPTSAFFSKGTHAAKEFVHVAKDHFANVGTEHPKHQTWRWVPTRSGGGAYAPAQPGARGSFPVTVVFCPAA